jgi:hypothetical protein
VLRVASAASRTMPSFCVSMLLSVCMIQFLVIVHLGGLLGHLQHSLSQTKASAIVAKEPELGALHVPAAGTCAETTRQLSAAKEKLHRLELKLKDHQLQSAPATSVALCPGSEKGNGNGLIATPPAGLNSNLTGVMATLMLHAPQWFQRRYSVMIQNAVNNMPPNWKVQIFHTGTGQSKHGLDINPGIQKLIDQGQVILTLIPPQYGKFKRYEMMMVRWLWSNMLAEKVFVFGGNSIICSNSPRRIEEFLEWDYIGSPWDFKKGVGCVLTQCIPNQSPI